MLNGNSSYPGRESAVSRLPSPHQNYLKVGVDTGCNGLSRLANLMAKLDIEPDWLRADRSACGGVLEVIIGFGEDDRSMERFVQRLSGMVSVCYLVSRAGPVSGHCVPAALDAGAV